MYVRYFYSHDSPIGGKMFLYSRHIGIRMTVETDERGRLYLSKDLRRRHGNRFHIVEYRDRIELVPIDDDPLEGLRAAVGDAFDGKSVEELRQEARDQVIDDAEDDVHRD